MRANGGNGGGTPGSAKSGFRIRLTAAQRIRLSHAGNILCCIALLDRPVDRDLLCARIDEIAAREWRVRACPDRASARYWVPVAHYRSGDWVTPAGRLEGPDDAFSAVVRHQPEQFEPGTPLWRIVAMEGDAGTKQGGALLFFGHHAFADGLQSMSLLQMLSDGYTPPRDGAAGNDVVRKGGSRARAIVGLFRLLVRELGTGRRRRGTAPISPTAANRIIPLDLDYQRLRRAVREAKRPFAEVLLALAAAAAGDVLAEALGERPETVAVVFPRLAGRGASGGEDRAGFLPLIVQTPTGGASAKALLDATEKAVTAAIGSTYIEAYHLRTRLLGVLPAFLRQAIVRGVGSRYDLLCTIVPGPQHEVTIGGARLTALYGVPALSPHQVGELCFLSYAGRLYGCLVPGRSSGIDGPAIAAAFAERFDWMLRECAKLESDTAPPERPLPSTTRPSRPEASQSGATEDA